MRMHLAIAAVCVFFVGSTSAGVFRCQVNGETVYSDKPCADDAEEVLVRVTRPDVDAQAEAAARATSIADHQRAMAAERRQREVRHEIDDLESRIRVAQRAMDAELAALRARKATAANNLAGATLEQGIAAEMQAVTAKHQARIDAAQARLKQLYTERDRAAGE